MHILLLIYFSSNVMVTKLQVIHLRVTVPMKIVLRLFRSKTVCSYKVLLSFLQSVHTFCCPLTYLTVIYLQVAVSMKTELRLSRSKTVFSYNVLLSCSQSADRHSLLFGPMFVNNFSRQILPVIQPSAFLTIWAGFL